MHKGRVKAVLLGIVVLLVAIQFVQPQRTNPPAVAGHSVQARAMAPPQVDSVIQRACYNCHSYQTVWPWYGHIAPVSWLLVDDVTEARRHMNFNDWDAVSTAGNAHMMCEDVREGDMPPLDYRIMHSEARLSASDKNAICSWATAVSDPARPDGTTSPASQ